MDYLLDDITGTAPLKKGYADMDIRGGGRSGRIRVTDDSLFISSGVVSEHIDLCGSFYYEDMMGNGRPLRFVSGEVIVEKGGSANDIAVSGGILTVNGTATNISWTPFQGEVDIAYAEHVTFTSRYSGVYYGYDDHLSKHTESLSSLTISKRSGGPLEKIFVMDGGKLSGITATNGAEIQVWDGGNASGITLSGRYRGYLAVLSGGFADKVSVKKYGELRVFSGGSANAVTLTSGGFLTVWGGTVTNLKWTPFKGELDLTNNARVSFASAITGIYYGTEDGLLSHKQTMNSKRMLGKKNDYVTDIMYVMNSGTANDTTVEYGTIDVFSGGTVNNTVFDCMPPSSYDYDYSYNDIRYGQLDIHSGGVANNTTATGKATLYVNYGGKVYHTTLNNEGAMFVSEGGFAGDTHLAQGAMRVSSGGIVSKTTVSGKVSFDPYTWFGDDAYDVNLMVQDGGVAVGTTIGQDARMRVLSGGIATDITIQAGGYVYVEKGGKIGSVTNLGGTFQCEDGVTLDYVYDGGWGPVIVPDGCSPDNDDRWNNWIYNTKTKKTNDALLESDPAEIDPMTGTIQFDTNKITEGNGFTNYVGYGDAVDYRKIHLNHAAMLSFSVTATDAAKFTVWKLNETKKKDVTAYSMESMQATKITRDKETGEYFANTKPLLLDVGDYYISVESTNAKKKNNGAYYEVEFNSEESVFFTKGNKGDDWSDMKKNGAESDELGDLNPYYMYEERDRINDWVGYGDAVDYRRFTIKDAAKLSFTVNSTDKVKVTLYNLAGSHGKYSLKSLSTASSARTLREKPKDYYDPWLDVWYYDEHWDSEDGKDYTATTKPVLLEKGEYYLCVESTNAKSGGSVDYDVCLDVDGCSFFDRGNNEDDWTDMKTKGAESKEIRSFNLEEMLWDEYIEGDWVGMGDEVDYRRFTVDDVAKLSFEVYARDKVKVTLYVLAGSYGEYSLKSLASATSRELRPSREFFEKNEHYDEGEEEYYSYSHCTYTATTKETLLEKGEYYLCVESTNAKNGGNADYELYINGTTFKNEGDDEDPNNWSDMKENGAESKDLCDEVSSLDDFYVGGWVGMNDPVDYFRFSVTTPQIVSFSVYAHDATEFSICRLSGNKGNYTLNNLQTTSVSKLKKTKFIDDGENFSTYEYGADTKSIILDDPGEYYLRVKSTNAEKGGNSCFHVSINSGVAFAADEQWNNRLVDNEKKLVPEAEEDGLISQRAVAITDLTKEIQFDENQLGREVWIEDEEYEVKVVKVWNNFVGYGDDTDFVKITLDKTAKVSFNIEAADKAKFIIYSLSPGKNGTYTQKAIQTTTLKKKTDHYSGRTYVYKEEYGRSFAVPKTTDVTYYAATTKSIKLSEGEYYIAVQSTNAKKGGAAYYNVSLNVDGCSGLPEGLFRDLVAIPDADDGWNDYVYDKNRNQTLNPHAGELLSADGENYWEDIAFDKMDPVMLDSDDTVWRNYVGYGDPTDFAKLTLDYAARLSFTIKATGAVQFSVWRLAENANGTSEMTIIRSETMQEAGTMTMDNVLIDTGGTYFLSMESVYAARGGDAYYNVTLSDSRVFFWGDNSDDWTDMSTNGAAGQVEDRGVIDASSDILLIDWVGYGDAVDYKRFTLQSDAKLNFKIYANDAKFSICRLASTTKQGKTVYSLETLQTTVISGGNALTNLLSLKAGDYYFRMESTNAAEGGEADYEIQLNSFAAQNADALTGPEEIGDWNAAASSVASDGLSAGTNPAQDVSMASAEFGSESMSENLFGESGRGMLASL